MIQIPGDMLTDQQGMERFAQYYTEQLHKSCAGTLNELVNFSITDCDFAERTLTVAVPLEPWMANPNGALHGGMIATVADIAMGVLCRYFSDGYLTPTIQMNVTFLSPAKVGDTLYCRAHCDKAGFTVSSAVCGLWVNGQEDSPVATATATYYVNRKRR